MLILGTSFYIYMYLYGFKGEFRFNNSFCGLKLFEIFQPNTFNFHKSMF